MEGVLKKEDEAKSGDHTEGQAEGTAQAEGESETGKNVSAQDIEKQQEAQLRSKYPGIKGPGGSAFLQKRLSKGTKYFDSGDYNMAKASVGPGGKQQVLAPGQKLLMPGSTGDTIPTPETVPHKKLGPQQSKLAGLS